MLRDKDYFAVESSEIGTVNSKLIFNAMVVTIPISLVSGYCYDLFGRKVLIMINSFLMCFLCYWTPFTSPSLAWLQFTYVLVRGTLIFVSCNPLLADYVEKNSLGKASALQNMGSLIGDCFAMGFLMTVTAKMPHEAAFQVTAIIIGLLILPLFLMILEPNIRLDSGDLDDKNSDPDQDFEVRATADTSVRRTVDDEAHLGYIG
jgi:MFS family permease